MELCRTKTWDPERFPKNEQNAELNSEDRAEPGGKTCGQLAKTRWRTVGVGGPVCDSLARAQVLSSFISVLPEVFCQAQQENPTSFS